MRIIVSILFFVTSIALHAQCDTTGVLLELQATTNIQGLLFGDNRCVVQAKVGSPLYISNDSLLIDTAGLGGAAREANNGVSDNEAGGKYRLGNRYMNGSDAPFTMDRKVNISDNSLYFGDNTDSTLLVLFGLDGRVGIKTTSASRTLHVNGEVRITDLDTDAPTVIVGADADGDLSQITVGTGLSLSGGVLSTSGGGNYDTFRDDGVDETGRSAANFVSSATVDFVLTDDAGNNETEIQATVPDNSIGSAKIPDNAIGTTEIAADAVGDSDLRNSAALSVIGRSANSVGDPADITAGTDNHVLRRSGTSLGFGTVATGGIADDAVTYAKLQNVVANNVLLGNDNGANQNAQELSVAEVYTMLGITGVANRFALFTGANTIGSDAAFTFDGVNDRMTITGTAAGVGVGILNINTGAIAGATEFLRASGNINGNMVNTIINTNNTNAANNTILQLASGGAASGDAVIQFTVNGVITHAIGIDNTDDRFKITPNAAAPGANVNMGVIVRDNSGTGNVGINKDFPNLPLDGLGIARFELWEGTGNEWQAADVAFGAGAGTGPSISTIVGLGNAVRITFSTGTTPTADGDVLIIAYPFLFTTTSIVTFSARDSDAADTNFYISAEDNAGCTLKVKGTLAASTTYAVNLHFWGY